MLSIIGALVVGKFAAAEITGRMYGYTRDERLTIWSLTLPQVAATLAATLVAYKTLDRAGNHLLDDRMLNVVLALMLSTSILGPVLTERFAPRLRKEKATPAGEQRASRKLGRVTAYSSRPHRGRAFACQQAPINAWRIATAIHRAIALTHSGPARNVRSQPEETCIACDFTL